MTALQRRLAAGATAVLALLSVMVLTRNAFLGDGADMAHHYWLVSWLTETGGQHRRADFDLGVMEIYPPAAHLMAASVGVLVGSPFLGMHVVGVAAAVLLWVSVGGIVTSLPGRQRWWSAGVPAAFLLLSVPGGPLRYELHGREITEDFFFAQLVGQALFWTVAWYAVLAVGFGRRHRVVALPVAAAAVVCTFFHVMPALQILVLLGLLTLRRLLGLWQEGVRSLPRLAAVAALPPAAGLLVLVSPGFNAMRRLALNDGAIDLAYLKTVQSVVLLALALAVVSVLALVVTRTAAVQDGSRHVVEVVGAVGLAVALPCLLQALALFGGEGSPYAVKKYGYGLTTALILQLSVLVGALVRPRGATRPPALRSADVVLVSLLAVTAVWSVFVRTAAYAVDQVLALESRLSVLQAQHLPRAPDAHAYAVGLPGGTPALDYMFSLAPLGAAGPPVPGEPAPPDEGTAANAILEQSPVPALPSVRTFVTGPTSSYARPECRLPTSQGGLVVTEAQCWFANRDVCGATNRLGFAGSADDARLEGFSGAEPDGRWTDGSTAEFRCRLPEPLRADPVSVSVDATPFLAAGVPRQRLVISVGDERLDVVAQAGRPVMPLQLSAPSPADGVLVVRLELPDAVAPAAVGAGADDRELGWFVRSINLG